MHLDISQSGNACDLSSLNFAVFRTTLWYGWPSAINHLCARKPPQRGSFCNIGNASKLCIIITFIRMIAGFCGENNSSNIATSRCVCYWWWELHRKILYGNFHYEDQTRTYPDLRSTKFQAYGNHYDRQKNESSTSDKRQFLMFISHTYSNSTSIQ